MEKAVGCLMDDEEGSGTFLYVGATPPSETVFSIDATPSDDSVFGDNVTAINETVLSVATTLSNQGVFVTPIVPPGVAGENPDDSGLILFILVIFILIFCSYFSAMRPPIRYR